MFRSARSSRTAAFASLAVLASLWLPQAAAEGAATHSQAASRAARPTSAGPSGINLASAPWLRRMLAEAPSRKGVSIPAGLTIGNFKSCPKLPSGYDPSQFGCYIDHITGGQLIIGNSDQLINRNITVTFAAGTDPSGNFVEIFGGMKSKPMPVAGGIFLNGNANNLTQGDRYLALGVAPKGLGITPDPTGNTAGFISMRIHAVNPAFGHMCFIGSAKDPLTVDPTVGTTNPPPPNSPISGSIDGAEFLNNEVIIIATMVDNAFAAPSAHGCGPRDTLDRVVNEVAGLPSPAGTNTAIFQSTIEAAGYQTLSS